MRISLSDEKGIITEEMFGLMQQAADEAFRSEFEEYAEAAGLDINDIDIEVSLTLAGDDEIKELNREYRSKDSVTDVLSFPQFGSKEELLAELTAEGREETLAGDVVICAEQAERQAAEYGTGIKREMLYLFVHSIMHLFGYDHMDEEEKKLMRAREEEVLKAIGAER